MKHSVILPVVLFLHVLSTNAHCGFVSDDRPYQVAILSDDFGGLYHQSTVELVTHLRQDGFTVTELSAEQVCDKRELSVDKFELYIIPNCRTYPAQGLQTLVHYVQSRGHILLLGGPLLDDPVWRSDSRWLNKEAILAAKKAVRPTHRPFLTQRQLTADGWVRTTDDRANPGTWEVVPDGPKGAPCFRYTTENLQGWDGYLSAEVPTLFGHEHDLFTFEAKGSGRTSQVAIEIQEADGSRWIAVASIDPKWDRIVLEPQDFKYWPDSRTRGRRGREGDHLQPAQARRVNFQLAHSHTTAVLPGEHAFWIANIGTCKNPVAGMNMAVAADGRSLESIFPRYKVYGVHEPVTAEAATRTALAGIDFSPVNELTCGIPRTTGQGFRRGQKWRFIPLARALDAQNRDRGYPAWILLNQSGAVAGSAFACLGWNDTEQFTTPPLLRAVSQIAARLQHGVFLQEAGAEHFVYWPGEKIEFGATLINMGRYADGLTVRMTVNDDKGAQVLAESQQLDVNARSNATWQTSTLAVSSPTTLQVTTELLAAGQVIDRIEHEVSVLDTGSPAKDSFLSVKDSNFMLRGKKWYPVGVNFWPLYVSGMDYADYRAGWIQRCYYDPQLVEQDLVRMKALGINMVSIQSNEPKYYRNLLDFVNRCGRHDIYVNLFCGLASPISLREEELREFIDTARLADNQIIMAYDTIWEPGNYVFRSDWRQRWNHDWQDWIIEQYGSLDAAEQDWQFRCSRDPLLRPVAPPDKYFRDDGPWRIMMAAYRRFMDDLMSRKWNRAHRTLRKLDPNHLISFRQGNTLPHDFTFTATAKHIDFVCPEGYAIPHTEDGYSVAGFITKYVHFTTDGKPIVWSEFGQSVWDPLRMEPSAGRIAEVSDYHDLFYRMVLETGANGTIPWWWPGGYRVGERSDYGIVGPDGMPRPAAKLIAKYGPRLTTGREWPQPTTWFEMDRDSHAGGYWHVCFNSGRDAYRRATAHGNYLGIRTEGTGTTSADTPMLAIGNRPCNGENPPKFLNAEFNQLEIRDAHGRWMEASDGAKIQVARAAPVLARISVGNTQEATWNAPTAIELRRGDVVLTATENSELSGRWPLPEPTPYLTDAEFGEIELALGINRTTRVELRMHAHQRSGFGEKRSFMLVVE